MIKLLFICVLALSHSLLNAQTSIYPKQLPWEFLEINPELKRDVLKVKLEGSNSGTIEPVMCSIADQYLFMILQIDPVKNTIERLTHATFSKSDWARAVKEKNLTTKLTETIALLERRLNTKATYINPLSNALHLQLTTATENHRSDEGSRVCLNLLLIEKYLINYTVINPLSGEKLAELRYRNDKPSALRRSTRDLVTRWQFPEHRTAPKLPLSLQLKVNVAEGVFGKTIPLIDDSNVELSMNSDQSLQINWNKSNLPSFIEQEATALNIKESPQIAKVYGAWVYLDKGRAFGLRMNDRLVFKENNNMIRGHVVGWFGPEEKLKSPRGYSINEGAIVFIRKGQDQTKIGQEFVFDQTTVPNNSTLK